MISKKQGASSTTFTQAPTTEEILDTPVVANIVSTSDEEEEMLWEADLWVSVTKTGKQKTPNMIRNELQKYIDECKENGTSTQSKIVKSLAVDTNSFRKFMNQWSATKNETYWAVTKLLEKVKLEKKLAKTATASARLKRKTSDFPCSSQKKSKLEIRSDLKAMIARVHAVPNVSKTGGVYDSCTELVAKIKKFLNRDGMTKALFLEAVLGGVNPNTLAKFLAGKIQDQCGNIVYRTAYVFFEKLRILEGGKKSKARKRNEEGHPKGFSLTKERSEMWDHVYDL